MVKNKIPYLLGSMISNFGDGIQQIAIMWYIYHLTGDVLSIGYMIAIYYFPSILLTLFVCMLFHLKRVKECSRTKINLTGTHYYYGSFLYIRKKILNFASFYSQFY